MANPVLVKKNAIAKTPNARRRSDRFAGVGGAAPGGKSAPGAVFFQFHKPRVFLKEI
jgi:hypothetical protein